MRTSLISLLVVLIANAVLAENYKNEKVKLGKKTCTCSFKLETDNGECVGKPTAKCDKKCTGSGSVGLGGVYFTMEVKKGKAKISDCGPTPAPLTGSGSGPVPPTGSGPEPPTGSGSVPPSGLGPMPPTGSGSGPVPPTGSGSGPVPPTGSGSGSVPPTGSGSGSVPPSGSGSGPVPPIPEGESMQCQCNCDCPDGSSDCQCACNCPNQAMPIACGSGFTKVCPMMNDMCPDDMVAVCPTGMVQTRNVQNRMHGQDSCQCVPDFLLVLVPGIMGMTGAPAAGRKAETYKNEKVKLGKKTCTCSFKLETDNGECIGKPTAKCDKKCTGSGSVGLGGVYFTMDVKKGKATISDCGPTPSGPEPLTGSGPVPPTMPGSGSGSGSGAAVVEGPSCSCVAM